MSRIIIPGARTASPARRLVTPQGGWWTGAGTVQGDGVDDRVAGVDPGIRGAAPWTMACWAFRTRSKAVGSWDGCMGIGNTAVANAAAYFGFTNPISLAAPKCQLGLRLTLVGGTRHIEVGWHRIVARYDGANATLHEDGVQDGAAVPIVMALGAGPCELLRFFSSNSYCGRINMIDARIYSRAITPAEIATDLRGEWISDTGLVRHWPFEAIVGGTTHERIGNTWDAVTGAVVDANNVPFRARAAAPARTAA